MARKTAPNSAPQKGANDYLWKANKKLPASLITRLAEAADGIRNGKEIYFVAQLKPDPETGHDVIGHFSNPDDALKHPKAKVALESGGYLIFGPFETKDDEDYEPKNIEKVVIYPCGKEPITLEGDKFDCVFWSLSAVDKFVMPYYTSLGGLERAKRVRKDFIKTTSIAGIHIPGSDIVNDTSASTSATPEEIRDRVGLYLWRETGGEPGSPDTEFIPL